MKAQKKPPTWPDEIYDVFKQVNIRQVAYVPDAGHTRLINRCHADKSMKVISLTTEEEGVAMLAGSWLGGDRGALLLQSSGVGNCINLLSIMQECRFPLLMMITMRGEFAEFNPWQVPMSRATQPVLEAMGLTVMRVERQEDVADVVQAGLDAAFESGEPIAVLLSQRLIGRKKWVAKP